MIATLAIAIALPALAEKPRVEPGLRAEERKVTEAAARHRLADLDAGEAAERFGNDGGRKVIGIVRRMPYRAAHLQRRIVDGAEVRVAEFSSPGAARVRLHFTNFALAEGESLFVCSKSVANDCQGPFTGAGPLENGDFWSPPVQGDTAVIEYRGTSQPFEVEAMTHTFPETDALECQPPVAPEWALTARSVASIDTISNVYGLEVTCSGVLLRTDALDMTPYLLTANHCVPDQATAEAAIIRWRFDASDSTGITSPVAGFLAGSDTYDHSDYSLLMVHGAIPRDLVRWADWTTTMPAPGTDVVGLHHPNGGYDHFDAWTRMAAGKIGADCTCFDCECPAMLGVKWNEAGGFTEKGSSGSGLWSGSSAAPKLVGQLWGGSEPSSCSNFHPESYYGRFDWTYADLATKRTPHWLSAGTDDANEDNDTSATATVIGHGVLYGRVIKFNDPDWYRITVPAGQRLVVDVGFPNYRADVDLEMYVGTTLIGSSETQNDFERLQFVSANNTTTEVLLKVFLYTGQAGGVRNRYSITTALATTGPATVSLSTPDPTAVEGTTNGGTFTVSRTGSTAASLTVYYALSGTATNGADFQQLGGIATFAAGASTTSIAVTPLQDALYEGPETVKLRLSSGPGYSTTGTIDGTVTITDDEPVRPTVIAVAEDPTATELGATPGMFRISRSGNTASAITIDYSIGGTASNGFDYQSISGSVTLAANVSSATIDVLPVNDSSIEWDETVVLTITASANSPYVTTVPYRATVTIHDDDNPLSTVTASATDSRAIESSAGNTTGTIRFVRTGGTTTNALAVQYVVGGTATNGVDYSALSGSITIPAGATEALLTITPVADNAFEPDETVTVTVQWAQGYNVGTPSYGQVTIVSSERIPPTPFDLSADTRSDIVWRDSSGANVVWLMNGGTVTASAYIDPLSNGMNIAGQGDFDGDRKADLLWRNSNTGENAIWFMNGTTVARGVYLPPVETSWQVVGLGDFNDDGRADIFWNRSNGENAIWMMDAETVTGAYAPSAAPPWQPGPIGDFDGNGTADITWRDGDTGQIAVWLMNGAAVSASAYLPTAHPDWLLLHAGDLNGDGRSDLLWRNAAQGASAVWFMNGLNLTSSEYLPFLEGGWTNAGVGDFDGDGDDDLLWRSASTSQTAMWLMDGVNATGVYLPSVAPSWSIARRR